MAQFGFTTVDSLPAQHMTTAQIRASILARDAASREDSQQVIIAQAVVSTETGHIMPNGRMLMRHEYCAVYEDGSSYVFAGGKQEGTRQHFTVLPERFDVVLGIK